MKNFGYIQPVIHPEDFVFGAQQLGDSPLNPSGQWDDSLPRKEVQNVNGIEPFACVSFATLNVIETLLLHEFGKKRNLSDRWLAWASGTKALKGNRQKTVVETLRKKGDVPEKDWEIDSSVKDFDSFYAEPPRNLWTLALNLIHEFEIGYEWVGSNPGSLKQALTYSPLTVGVYAWEEKNGLYVRPEGAQSRHATMLYGYVDGEYWKVYDSYANETKKLSWDFGFDAPMRYTLHRQIVREWRWRRFLKGMRKLLGL